MAKARSRRRTRVAATILVALLIAVVATTRRITAPPPPEETTVAAVVTTEAIAAMAETATEFFPLLYSEVPAIEPQIVRLELPRTALALFGLGAVESVTGLTAETVSADVLVGEDGLARAVRFVTRASHREQEP